MHSNVDEPQKNPAMRQKVGKRNTYDMIHKHKIPSNGTESQWWWSGDVRRGGEGKERRITKGLGTLLGCVHSHCLHCDDGFMGVYICQNLPKKYFPSTPCEA